MYESHLHVQMQLKKGNSSKRRSGPADEAYADGVVGKESLIISKDEEKKEKVSNPNLTQYNNCLKA